MEDPYWGTLNKQRKKEFILEQINEAANGKTDITFVECPREGHTKIYLAKYPYKPLFIVNYKGLERTLDADTCLSFDEDTQNFIDFCMREIENSYGK